MLCLGLCQVLLLNWQKLYMWQMVGYWGRCCSLCAEQSGRCYRHGHIWNSQLSVNYKINAFSGHLVTHQPDGSLNTTVYRKPSHSNLYFQWESHHIISAKCSVVNTLHQSNRTVCSSPQFFQKEEYLHNVLTRCKYPLLALNMMKLMIRAPTSQANYKRGTNTTASITFNNQMPHMSVPYTKGLSESLRNVCGKHGVQMYFRGSRTISCLLVVPKVKDSITKKSWVIYTYKGDGVECDEEYIEESSRTFGKSLKGNFKAPSPIYNHFNITGHTTTIDNFSIVGREDQNLIRTIKEALCIRVNNPSLKT